MPRCHVVLLLLACCAWLLARQTTDALQSVCGKDYESGQAPPIAFVASLKPVTDLTSADAIRQLNALRSWKSLHAATEVYVVGDDTAATLGDLVGATFIPGVQTRPSGVPLLNDMLTKLQAATTLQLLAFVNADIVFTKDVNAAVSAVCDHFVEGDEVLLIGQRHDVPLEEELDFFAPEGVTDKLVALEADKRSFLQNYLYKDYFIFTRGVWDGVAIPPLAVGRAGIDDWIVKNAIVSNRGVVDITPASTVYHQIHSYSHVGGASQAWAGGDALANRAMAGDLTVLTDINRAPFQVVKSGDAVVVRRNIGATAVRNLYHAGFFTIVHACRDRPRVAVSVLLLGVLAAGLCLFRYRRRLCAAMPLAVLPLARRHASGGRKHTH